MRLVKGDPKDLIWRDNKMYCPHCGEALRPSNIDMGGNHSYFHSCHPRGADKGIRYSYSGRLEDVRKFRD